MGGGGDGGRSDITYYIFDAFCSKYYYFHLAFDAFCINYHTFLSHLIVWDKIPHIFKFLDDLAMILAWFWHHFGIGFSMILVCFCYDSVMIFE